MTGDLAAFGAPADIVDGWSSAAKEGDEPLAIEPDNWDSVRLFVWSGSQWRTAGMAGTRVGLDYAGVAVVAQAHGISIDAGRMADLQTMERAAMSAMAEQMDGAR